MKSLHSMQKTVARLEDMLNPKRIIRINYAAFTEEENKIMCEASKILKTCRLVENGDRIAVTATDEQHRTLQRAVEIINSHTLGEGEITEVHNRSGGSKLH